jgi:hypothetical protein
MSPTWANIAGAVVAPNAFTTPPPNTMETRGSPPILAENSMMEGYARHVIASSTAIGAQGGLLVIIHRFQRFAQINL